MKHANQTLTEVDSVIRLFLWLPFNSELKVKNSTVKVSERRNISCKLFDILYNKQLNRKSVKKEKSIFEPTCCFA